MRIWQVAAKRGGKPEEVGGEWGQERQKILTDGVETYSEGIWLPKVLSGPITTWRRGFPNERTEGLPLQDWHWIQNQRETNVCQVPRRELNGVHSVSQGRWGCSGRMRKEPFWGREPAKSNLEFTVGVTRKVPELIHRGQRRPGSVLWVWTFEKVSAGTENKCMDTKVGRDEELGNWDWQYV